MAFFPGKKIRILIVDDSFLMQKILHDLLASEPLFEIVGEAKDGQAAVQAAAQLRPDVITMDYHLPIMNGDKAIAEISALNLPKPPAIIMLSAYAQADTEETFACLKAGAIDFIAKPSGEVSLDLEKIGQELIEKIKVAARAKIIQQPEFKINKLPKRKLPIKPSTKAVVIGASTGGPPLIEDILVSLGKDFPAPLFIAQHMPDFFLEKFATRLDRLAALRIRLAQAQQLIMPGEAYVSPAKNFLGVKSLREKQQEKFYIQLISQPGYVGASPSINAVMESLAYAYGANLIGVVLTGMGEDGKAGAEQIKVHGGYVIAQDPSTAAVDSMPSEIIKAGLADEVLKPEAIAKRLWELVQ